MAERGPVDAQVYNNFLSTFFFQQVNIADPENNVSFDACDEARIGDLLISDLRMQKEFFDWIPR